MADDATVIPDFNWPFTAYELTEQINRIPNLWGTLQTEGLFREEYPPTTTVRVDFQDGVIRVLEAQPRGSAGPNLSQHSQKGVLLEIPHIPATGVIAPGDLQNQFAFDGTGQRRLKTLADATADRLEYLRDNQAQTLEFLRWGALKGQVISGEGSVYYDFFEVFGIGQKVVDLGLDKDSTNVLAKCNEIKNYMKTHLFGERMDGIGASWRPTCSSG